MRVVVGKKTPVGFLTTRWSPPALAVKFPAECPHCGRPTERTRRYSTQRATSLAGVTAKLSTVMVEVPVCRRVLPSLVTRLLVVFAAFWVVVFWLMVMFSVREGPAPLAIGLLVTAVLGLLVALRAHLWFRVITFDPGSITFAVWRRDYGRALAALNPPAD